MTGWTGDEALASDETNGLPFDWDAAQGKWRRNNHD
jgi:hypothetical protein